MVFSDWIQLFRATQCSVRHSHFGRLEYWQTVLHPSSNRYVLCKFPQTFTRESWLRPSLSPESSDYYLRPPIRLTPPPLRPPARTDFLTAKATLSPYSERAMGYAPPTFKQGSQIEQSDKTSITIQWGGVNDLDAVFTLSFRYPWAPLLGDLSSNCAAGLHIWFLDVISVWCSA